MYASDSILFAGNWAGVWRRPLSEMISSNSVEQPAPITHFLVCYPNPLTSSTTITFSLSERQYVEVTVVNLLGAQIGRIFAGELDASQHSFRWAKPHGLPSGVYECVVRMNGQVEQTGIMVEP